MHRLWKVGAAALAATAVLAGAAGAAQDWGQRQDSDLAAHAEQQYGFGTPLDASSTKQVTAAEAQADPTSLVSLAQGLQARVVATTPDAQNIDMMALFPNDTAPTHILACNEQGTTNVSLVRITIATGRVENLLAGGTTSCDGVRRTPWGTLMFSEEAGGGPNGGRVYELLDPLATRPGATVNRISGMFSGTDAQNYVARPALGRLSFEGFALYPNGVSYYGDENRPANGKPGGAYFKFVPSSPWTGGAPIASLDQSPFAAGTVYGLRVTGGADYGQATQTGVGQWINLGSGGNQDLRAMSAAPATLLTGYYRPEDIDIDRGALADGKVRFCGNDTGNEANENYGETVCVTDGTLGAATTDAAKPQVEYLVMGNPELAMPDNMAYQPGTGNWVIHEDGETDHLRPHNNDLWDCLDDGADADVLSDGCVRMATLNDLTAEWTGGIFDGTGSRLFVSVQHNISGRGTVLEITGFKR